MRKILYALLVLLPLWGIASLAQADEQIPNTSNITITSTAGLSKGNYNFGTVTKANVTKKFTITNRGPAELLITALGITAQETGFEIVTGDTCVNKPLKKWNKCQFVVKYTPKVDTYNKNKTATLYIEGNLTNGRKEIKLLAKNGLRPTASFSLSKNSDSNANKNGVFSFNFGKANDALSKTVYIRNTGNTALVVSAITLEDMSNQWQVNNSNCEKTIPVRKYCALTLQFTPNGNYYKKTVESSLVASTNDPLRQKIVAKFKIRNNLKPVNTDNDNNQPTDNQQTNQSNEVSNCPGACMPSETQCLGEGKVIDHVETHRCHVDGNPVCCVTGQPDNTPPNDQHVDQPQNNCPGSCFTSETECRSQGKTIDYDEAHRCNMNGYPVCCVAAQTPPAEQTVKHAASCAETDGYKTNAETDYKHQGTVSGYNQDGTVFNFSDSCSGNTLTEYFCSNPILTGLPVWYSFQANCAADPDEVCRNGACVCKPELDADGDGICNTDDLCPSTSAGKLVDFTGC